MGKHKLKRTGYFDGVNSTIIIIVGIAALVGAALGALLT